MKRLITLALAVSVTSCATNPNSISPNYLPPSTYAGDSCAEIAAELASVNQRVIDKTADMKKKRTGDQIAVGVSAVLFWPALFFVKGKSNANDMGLANLKGRQIALTEALRVCT